VIVLNKFGIKTCLLKKVFFVEAFQKETPIIPKDLGFNDQNIRDFCLNNLHKERR
jgi:hypothetical protein